ncbi:MAG: hypothetical protein JWN40_3000 [Phycisphaerales bacterium]|nr:hypothetical protein [Phycisphaerales bacterium]
MNRLMLTAMLGLVCVGTGCATIRGDKQKMTIETEPSGANLVVDGQRYTTPAQVELKRKDTHRIAVEKEGYRPIAFNLESTWDGASMTDLALPGGSALMGASVVTGSDKQFNQLGKIKLEKTSEAKPTQLEMYQYRGRLLIKSEYDKAILAEQNDRTRFMGPDNN